MLAPFKYANQLGIFLIKVEMIKFDSDVNTSGITTLVNTGFGRARQ